MVATRIEVERPPTQYFPYCAVDNLVIGINLVCQEGVDIIDRGTLAENGIDRFETYKLTETLQFLGLTGEDGNLTDKAIELRTSKKRMFPSILRRIVREAYGPESIAIAKESLHAPSDLAGYFMEKNGGKKEMANRSSRLFLALLTMGNVKIRGMSRRFLRRIDSPKRSDPIISQNIPSSQILTLEMVKSMTEDELTAWFRERLRSAQKPPDPDEHSTTIFFRK